MTECLPPPVVDRMARAICQERYAFMGEPACWAVADWPNRECDEPGCMALAQAAHAAIAEPPDADPR